MPAKILPPKGPRKNNDLFLREPYRSQSPARKNGILRVPKSSRDKHEKLLSRYERETGLMPRSGSMSVQCFSVSEVFLGSGWAHHPAYRRS